MLHYEKKSVAQVAPIPADVCAGNRSEKIRDIPTLYPDLSRDEMLAFVPEDVKRVLDVGCNLGGFGHSLKLRSKVEVWGIEPNTESAESAIKFLDHVIPGYFSEALGLPDNYFDAIIFNDVLEHMADPWSALSLARKKIRQDGSVVVSIPNLRHIENLLHILQERDFKYEVHGVRDKTHLRFFTKKSAIRLFDGTGLSIVSIQGINEDWWRPSFFRRLAYRLFHRYLEDTRYIQFAIVSKPDS